MRSSIGITAAAVLALGSLATAARAEEACRKDTPSGFPVPRWVSLKTGEVNARVGPGEDYRILRTYRAKGLPVTVVAETRTWRRIRDPQGRVGWVIAGATSGRRTALRVSPSALALRRGPDSGAAVSAYLAGRAVAGLERCRKGWCKLKVGGSGGWAPAGTLWGAADFPQCR